MRPPSTAGVVADKGVWQATVYAASTAPLLTVALCLGAVATADGLTGPGIDELARRTRQKRHSVIAQLRRLVQEGWLVVERAGGGRGRRTEYRLALPALMRRDEVPETVPQSAPYPPQTVPPETPFAGETVSPGTPYSPETVPLGPPIRRETVAQGAPNWPQSVSPGAPFVPPPYPPLGMGLGDGEGTPLPPTAPARPAERPLLASTSAHARWQAEAEELVDQLPVKLRPIAEDYRAKVVDLTAGKLIAGWTPGDLLRRASQTPLPEQVDHPLGFLRNRWQGMPPATAAAGTPAPSSVREVLGATPAPPAAPEFITATAADLRRELARRRSS